MVYPPSNNLPEQNRNDIINPIPPSTYLIALFATNTVFSNNTMAPTVSASSLKKDTTVTIATPKPPGKLQIVTTIDNAIGSSFVSILPLVDRCLRTLSLDLIDTELETARKKSSLYKFDEIVKGVQFVSKSFRYKPPSFSVSAETVNHPTYMSILGRAQKKMDETRLVLTSYAKDVAILEVNQLKKKN